MEYVWNLIAKGQYEAASELLQQAHVFSQQTHKSVSANLLKMAQQICLELTKFHAEMEWHRQAGEEISKRKKEETERLQSLLSLAHRFSELDSQEIPVTSSPAIFHVVDENPIVSVPDAVNKSTAINKIEQTEAGATGKRPSVPWVMSSGGHGNGLMVYCLGTFQVYRNDEPIESWQSRKGAAIFKYLLMNRGRQIRKSTLMELFWPNSDEEAQRNNLNVAIYNMRQTLRNGDPNFSYVVYENDCYYLNPDLHIWVDYDEFLKAYKNGQRYEQANDYASALREYVAAESLYQGSFLPDDSDDDWIERPRQSLQSAYQSLLCYLSKHYFENGNYAACIAACGKMLTVDMCDEEAHRRLMHCYSRQGQVNLALRQYDLCVKALKFDLEIEPSLETQELYQRIRAGSHI
jgi:DNA-binding SARP family transcriptional activator